MLLCAPRASNFEVDFISIEPRERVWQFLNCKFIFKSSFANYRLARNRNGEAFKKK